jgi:hypothetical protein
MKTNKTRIRITASDNPSIPIELILEKLCGLRNARKIGDVETVNNTQLGKLKEQRIKFDILNFSDFA